MRGMILLASVLIGLAAPAQEPEAAESFWKVSGERLGFEPAKLSAPRRAGSAEYFETTEFSHKGEGVDTAIKYRSADQKVFATLYVYYPSLAHSGVQAIATDQAILGASQPATAHRLGAGTASAGGKAGVAVTADYDHYRGDNFTKAAFIKAGRWMLKLRVTGPESRSAEVSSVMTALLDGLRFEGGAQPYPATPIAAGECAAADRPDAKTVEDRDSAQGDAELGTLDGAGQVAASAPRGKAKPLPARVGRDWCRTLLQVGDQQVTVLQAKGAERPGRGTGVDSALLVLYSDGGGILEVVRLAKEKRYVVLNHDIAEMRVLDRYDALPSLAQIGRLFSGGAPIRVRATVKLHPDGSTEVGMPIATAQ